MPNDECRMNDDAGRAHAEEAPRLEIVEAAEGEWVEMPPPDCLPHFRCVVRGRGSVVRPGKSDGTHGQP